jgi:hypothetical protein
MSRQSKKALAEHYDKAFEEFRRQDWHNLPEKAQRDLLVRLTLQRLVSVFSEPESKAK